MHFFKSFSCNLIKKFIIENLHMYSVLVQSFNAWSRNRNIYLADVLPHISRTKSSERLSRESPEINKKVFKLRFLEQSQSILLKESLIFLINIINDYQFPNYYYQFQVWPTSNREVQAPLKVTSCTQTRKVTLPTESTPLGSKPLSTVQYSVATRTVYIVVPVYLPPSAAYFIYFLNFPLNHQQKTTVPQWNPIPLKVSKLHFRITKTCHFQNVNC